MILIARSTGDCLLRCIELVIDWNKSSIGDILDCSLRSSFLFDFFNHSVHYTIYHFGFPFWFLRLITLLIILLCIHLGYALRLLYLWLYVLWSGLLILILILWYWLLRDTLLRYSLLDYFGLNILLIIYFLRFIILMVLVL